MPEKAPARPGRGEPHHRHRLDVDLGQRPTPFFKRDEAMRGDRIDREGMRQERQADLQRAFLSEAPEPNLPRLRSIGTGTGQRLTATPPIANQKYLARKRASGRQERRSGAKQPGRVPEKHPARTVVERRNQFVTALAADRTGV